MFIEADSGQLWRVMENLFQNVSKYAMHGTRVYIEMEEEGEGYDKKQVFSVKNISAKYLEVEARQKLKSFHPVSVGQASRISGVSPADISVLLVYLEQYKYK